VLLPIERLLLVSSEKVAVESPPPYARPCCFSRDFQSSRFFARTSSSVGSLGFSGAEVSPELPESLPPELPESLPPELPESLPPELPESSPPELPESLPPELPESLPPELPESLPPELPESLPPELPELLPPELPELLPPELPESFPVFSGGVTTTGDVPPTPGPGLPPPPLPRPVLAAPAGGVVLFLSASFLALASASDFFLVSAS